ncbi:MAG: DinB family protein [Chloroflexota bacterium]
MMNENYLARIFEQNNWANQEIIEVCLTLTDEQLDAVPTSATYGTIRETLLHLIASQKGYLRTLFLPLEVRRDPVTLTLEEVQESATESGQAFLAIARDPSSIDGMTKLRTWDDYIVEPWVLMVQIINHGTEHREQIKSMLTAMGITPPQIDGWYYGEATGTVFKIES